MKNWKIYYLSDPITNDIRYIGYTGNTLDARLKKHKELSKYDKTYRANWVKSLLNKNLSPIIGLIENDIPEDSVAQAEIDYIYIFRRLGVNLVNGTDGGIGGKNHTITDETRIKLSIAGKGRRLSEAAKLKISRANSGRVHSDESKKKMSDGGIGRIFSEKHKDNLSASLNGRTHSKESRNKNSIAHQGRYKQQVAKIDSISNKTLEVFSGVPEAAHKVGINANAIYRVCNGHIKTAGTFIWKYIDNGPKWSDGRIFCETNNKTYNSYKEVYDDLGILQKYISRVCRGGRSHAGGYKFKFIA